MVREEIPSYRLSGLAFGIYSSVEIQKLSVKEVTNPQSFDALMHPTHGGLYDPALGRFASEHHFYVVLAYTCTLYKKPF